MGANPENNPHNLGEGQFALPFYNQLNSHEVFALGVRSFSQGDLSNALEYVKLAIRSQGNNPSYYNLLGIIKRRLGKTELAVAAFKAAIELAPHSFEVLSNLSMVFADLGRLKESQEYGQRAVQANPASAEAICNLGTVFINDGKIAQAYECFQQALTLRPNDVTILRNLAMSSRELGDFDQARRYFHEVLRINPRDSFCYDELARMRRHTINDIPLCVSLETMLSEGDLPEQDRKNLHFALGKMHEDMGDYDVSFSHYERANQIGRLPFDRAEHQKYIDQLIGYFTPNRFAGWRRWGSMSEVPIFVIGMFRSGTSLVEQILASHARVFGGGELGDIQKFTAELTRSRPERTLFAALESLTAETVSHYCERYLNSRREQSETADRVVDKAPNNFLSLWLIAILFPNARVIHCRRDPRDSGLSCFTTNFTTPTPFTNDLGDFAFFYRQYERLMEHWHKSAPVRIFDIEYEQLVKNQVETTHHLLDFCGLPWDERCLTFHQTERAVSTASTWQVRQSLYSSSLSRWQKFKRHLGPLLNGLGLRHESSN